jgi:glycosyltransferase involved in cell wall biosynthesis
MTSVLVTIPVRNEEHWIEPCVRGLRTALAATPWDWRIAIAEDGSTDGTSGVLRRLQGEFPDLIVASNPSRLGRGLALRRLWTGRSEDVFLFVDADLASGTEAVVLAIQEVLRGADVVTGSRYAVGAEVNRPPVRSLVSMGYNRVARILFREGVQDHQCGLKALSRRAVEILLPVTREDSWFWDTEVLVLAARSGVGVREIPIRWHEPRVDRTRWKRLLGDVYLHGTRLLSLLGRIDDAVLAAQERANPGLAISLKERSVSSARPVPARPATP